MTRKAKAKAVRKRPTGIARKQSTPPLIASSESESIPPRPHADFPIIGIGSSAGGVEALEEFFRHLPSDPGAAFVVVSHQPASHSSLLPELLRRWTSLPVIEATDGLGLQANTVYLPPTGVRLSIFHAVLHLIEAGAGTRPIMPIDFFFCSLAEDQQEMSVGIILSGTGSDGSVGIKAIKAEAGLTMAQEPASAKFAGMPQNAIATAKVDIVRRPAELGSHLCEFFHHRTHIVRQPDLEVDGKGDLNKLLVYIRDRTGNDFSLYKNNTTLRRIERRMQLHKIDTLANYLRYVHSSTEEVDALFQELLIGVTSFFRDPPVFELVAQKVLPKLLADKPDGCTIRAWVPACSTGEEAYSLAILLHEYVAAHKRHFTIQIFASDLDRRAIDEARQGLFPEGIANHVSPERLQRFFAKEDSYFRVKNDLRDNITFATHNLLTDPPFTKLHLLFCRNVLIYLKPETQHRLISIFHYALKPGGFLVLGNAESIDGFPHLFGTVDRRARIFSRMAGIGTPPPVEGFRAATAGMAATAEMAATAGRHRPSFLLDAIYTLLLDRFAPPSVLINRQGQVVYIHGRTGDYLEPASGLASQRVLDMARPGLRQPLMIALQLIEKQGGTVVREGIRLTQQGKTLKTTLSVTALHKPDVLEGLLLIVFSTGSQGASAPSLPPQRIPEPPLSSEDRQLLVELEYAHQQLHRTNEDLQLSNEEFKSANEELQSTNEELRSTNEELETTREELQSLNEELTTVNAQLQSKLDELACANDDLQNLVNSTEIATIFLNNDMRIKRFTPQAARVSKVIVSDIGRSFSDIVSMVHYPELMQDAQQVLHTLVFKEREVQSSDGCWYLLRMIPYRTSKNVIEGLVLSYVDITAGKVARMAMEEARLYAESIVDTVREPLMVLNAELRVVSCNRAFYRKLNAKREDVEEKEVTHILGDKFSHPSLRRVLEKVLVEGRGQDDVEIEMELPGGAKATWMANVRRFERGVEYPPLILLALESFPAGL